MGAAAEALAAESAAAGKGLFRLMAFDPRWAEGFDASTAGFLRSFIAPLLALPFYLSAAATLSQMVGGAEPDSADLAAAALSHLINAFGFPLVIGLLARPLRAQAGYAGFVVVMNWACLAFNVLLAATALLAMAGDPGMRVFKVALLIMFSLSIFVIWRAARENLSPDVPVALLVVVMSVAFSEIAEEAAGALMGLPS